MKKVLGLVKIQIWAMLGSMFAIGQYKKKKSKALYAGFGAFAIIMFAVSFIYAYSMGLVLKMYDSIELLPSIFVALTSIVVLFTSIFKVKGTLFGFKDYDMVMSLPVSNSKIVASRLILLYSINEVFVFIIMIPVMIAYGILVQPGVVFYIFSISMLLFIPLIPIVIASFLGTVVTYLSMRFRYSNVLYIVFTFLLLLTMITLPLFLGDSEEVLAQLSHMIASQINRIYPLARLYSKAVSDGNIIALLIFVAVSVLVFLIFAFAVGKVFKRINTVIMTGRHKANYKLGELKSSSPIKALYRKDLKRYFSSAVYVMNTGFGVVIMVLGAIALPFVDVSAVTAELNINAAGTIQDILPLFITFCIATSCTTMASISIEGRNLWIVKSLPVSAVMIFTSKILVNLTILTPVFFSAILMGITMRIPFVNWLLILMATVSCSVFMSLLGLVLNLSFPNLSWTNETVIVKQGTAAMISVFSGIGIVIVQFLLWMVIGNSALSMVLFICFICILIWVLYRLLLNSGRRKFERL